MSFIADLIPKVFTAVLSLEGSNQYVPELYVSLSASHFFRFSLSSSLDGDGDQGEVPQKAGGV